MLIPRRWRYKDGSFAWHTIYFDLAPDWMCKYSPPLGHYNYAAYLLKPHHYIHDLYLQVKWFIQRGRRGYSESDIWGWCSHHARVTVGVLTYLKEHKHGYPIGLTPTKWSHKLDVMIDGFQAMLDEEDDVTSYKRLSRRDHLKLIRTRQRKLRLALKYFGIYYWNLWD